MEWFNNIENLLRRILYTACIVYLGGFLQSVFSQIPDIVYTSGTYSYSKKLISVPGQGLDLNFSVEFKSRRDSTFFSNPLHLPLGTKWLHSYQWQIKIDKDTIRVYNPSGSKERFIKFIGDPWVHSTLRDSSGFFIYKLKDKTRYLFNNRGNLISIIDFSGLNEIKFIWALLPQSQTDTVLTQIIDTRGNSLLFSYDNQSSRVSAVEYKPKESANSLKAHFTYTTSGELRKIIDVNGDSTSFISEVSSSNIRSVINNEGKAVARISYFPNSDRINTLWDAAGSFSTYQYVPFDTTKAGRYSADSMLTVVNRIGSKQIVWYNRNQNIIKTRMPLTGYAEEFRYDDHGNMVSKYSTRPNSTVGTPKDTMMYDSRNNMICKITSRTFLSFDGKASLILDTTKNVYDSLDRLIMSIGPVRDTTRYEYGSTVSINLMSSSTDPFGNQTRYTYNGRGLQTEIIDGKGNTTTIFRNSLNGEVEFQSNPLGEKTLYSHDEFGRQILIVGPRNDSTRFVFDRKGRATRVIDALHNITSMVYDCDDNVIMDTLPDGAVNHYEFTPNGKLRKTINPSGDSVITEYNAEDQPVKRINEKGLAYLFSYDSTGRISSVKDPSGKQTTCTYDSANNINTITDPSGHTSTLTYDETKQLIRRENRLGNQTTISRSKDMIRMHRHTKTASDSTEGSEYFLFDKGRISMSFIAHGHSSGRNVNYYYDLTGNIDSTVIYNISEVRSPAPGISVLPERLGRSTYKKYDRLNRMISNTDRFGNTILYSYDKAGNIDTITYSDGKKVTYTYDLLNRMTSVTDWNNFKTSYSYDKTGNVVQINLPDSSTIFRTYDRSSRLVSHIDLRGNDTLLTFNYELDPVGNRTTQSTKVPVRPAVNDSTIDYTYNALNQLIEINGKSFSYDNAGNLASGFIASKQVSLTYTGNNQLQTIGTDSYDYDYGEREYRTFTRLNSQPTIYVNDVSEDFYQVLEEQDTTRHIRVRYVYGLGLISCQRDSSLAIYHFDPSGNTLALTDLKGQITDTYSYDPYGKLLSSAGNSVNPYRFGGRDGVRDDGNGLLFMRTRYYSPEMMRFIQMDRSSAGEISNPQTLNMYLYTADNPLNFTDPNGDYFGIDDAIEFAVGFVAGVVAQGISDLVTGETSSWETYLGSGLNGGITAWSTTYVGPVLGGMLGGALGNATTQGLSLLAGDQESWNWLSFGTDVGVGALGGVFGKAVGKVGAKVAPKLFNKGAGTAGKYFTKQCGTLKSWSKIIGKLIYQTGQKTVTKVGKNHFQTKVKPFVEENIGLVAILPLFALVPIFSLDD